MRRGSVVRGVLMGIALSAVAVCGGLAWLFDEMAGIDCSGEVSSGDCDVAETARAVCIAGVVVSLGGFALLAAAPRIARRARDERDSWREMRDAGG